MIISLMGCGVYNLTNNIIQTLQPAELYESFQVKPINLKEQSKCPISPTVNIVNAETKEEYVIAERPQKTIINPKELTKGIVEYLKYGFEISKIKVDSNSSKTIFVSFIDTKMLPSGFISSGQMRVNVNIPETKFSKIYVGIGSQGPIALGRALSAYAIHDITRKIIDDPVIQNYILCKSELVQEVEDQKKIEENP